MRFRLPSISPLTQLALDEQSLHQRKINIQRFGATWIRPPGIAKTLQGELDEKAEREEAERQAMMEDVDAGGEDEVFDDEDADVTRGEVEVDLDADIPEGDGDSFLSDEDEDLSEELEEEDEEEVDLDAEVPEAEADTLWESSEEEEDGEDGEDEEEEEEEEEEGDGFGYESEVEGTQHTAGIESSPHQAVYSHDEHFGPPDGRVEQRLRAYPRRALVRSDDEMEVDSDN